MVVFAGLAGGTELDEDERKRFQKLLLVEVDGIGAKVVNDGERGDYSDACGPLGVRGTHYWEAYTYNNEPLTTGTKIYVSPIDAMNQNPGGLSDPGAFSYGGYWYLTAGGVLGDRNSC